MEINQIPSPQFMINELGMFSLFLPAFEGEPDAPALSRKNETTLVFKRSKGGEIDLVEIEPEIVEALKDIKKLLVVETNVLKSIDLLDKALGAQLKPDSIDPEAFQKELKEAIERAYEIDVSVG